MMIRNEYTEDEHILLTKVSDEFCSDLAKIAVKALKKFDPEVQHLVMYQLQDSTSLYSPYTADKIREELDDD